MSLLAYESDYDKNNPAILSGLAHELKQKETIDDKFALLCEKYASFLNYKIFQSMVDDYCIDRKSNKSLNYPEQLKNYVNKHKLSEFIDINPNLKSFVDTLNSKELIVVMDVDSTSRLANVVDLKKAIAKILGLKRKAALRIIDIKKGCVQVTLLIPALLADLIFICDKKFTEEEVKKFQALSITRLQCIASKTTSMKESLIILYQVGTIYVGKAINLWQIIVLFLDVMMQHTLTLSTAMKSGNFHSATQVKTTENVTHLHYAAIGGNLVVVKFLIENMNYNPNCRDDFGKAPLHYASMNGHLNVVQYLVDTHHCDPMHLDKQKLTSLHLAAANGQLEILKYYTTTCHCDPQVKTVEDATPLHHAARSGYLKVVKFLIENMNCNSNSTDICCKAPLHYASMNGHLNVVQYLVDTHHCDPLYPDKLKFTPLHLAAHKGHLETIKYFTVTHRCEPQVKSAQNITPLHIAAKNGHHDVVKFLIEDLNCNPNSTNSSGQTPLHNASNGGHLDTVIYLVDRCQCDPLAVDSNGLTALELAKVSSHLQVYYYLSVITDTLPSSPMPSDMWSPPGHSHSYLYMWCLKYANSSLFFASLFIEHLRKMILISEDVHCTVWKNGTLFAYKNGTKAIMEVSEQTSRVYLVMQCVKGCELHLVEKRCLFISKIKSLTRKICPEIRIMECLLQPQKRYPPDITQEIPCSAIALFGRMVHYLLIRMALKP